MDISDDNLYLTVKDYSISQETFKLFHNKSLDLLRTHPQPNESDLSKYYQSDDYISHTDSKRSLFEQAYHFVKNIALKRKVGIINSLHKSKGTLLDIGAGTGDFLIAAQQNGWVVSGTEPSLKAQEIAAKKGVSFIESTSLLTDHSCDIITMWHVLEHVPNYANQIKELRRLLKPGGSILIAVPNFNSFDAKYYDEFWAAYDVPRHLWHFSKTAIDAIVREENLKLTQIIPMKFDAFYVSLLSEKYKTGRMNYINALRTGLKSNRYGKKNMEYSSHIYVIQHKNTN